MQRLPAGGWGRGYPFAGQCSWPSQVPPKSASCCGGGAGGAAGTVGQCSSPSQVPPKSVFGGAPGAAGVVEPADAGAPVVLVGGGVRGDETADGGAVSVTVTGASFSAPEHPAAKSATTAMATPNVFMAGPFAAADLSV